MVTSTVDEAQSQLAQLISLVEKGEEIVIAREGKPIVRLVPYHQAESPRHGGQWRGQVRIAPDFDELPCSLGEIFGLPAK
jgi:prevent-host-death family protein